MNERRNSSRKSKKMKAYKIILLILNLALFAVSASGQPCTITRTITGSAEVCVGATLVVYTTEAGMTEYDWDVSAGGTVTGGGTAADNTVTITWHTSGAQTVSVNYKDTDNCTESSPAVKNVNVRALPVATPGSNSPVCAGNDINLTGGPAGMTTYSWTGPDGFTSGSQNPTISAATAAKAGDYYLTVNDGTCSSIPVSTSVVVNALPVATPGANTPVCTGSDINLTGGPAGMTTYLWTGPDGFTSGSQNPTISAATAAKAGDYYLTVNDGTCSSIPVSTSVVVKALPVATAGSNSPVCEGSSINLTGGPAGMTYSWTGPDGFSSSTRNPSIAGATLAKAGTYNLVVTDADNCISIPASVNVSVTRVPDINNMTAPASDGVLFTVIPENVTNGIVPSGTIYSWPSPTHDEGISGEAAGTDQTSIHGTLYNSKSGSRTATYTVTPKNSGCSGSAFSLVVTVYPRALISAKTAVMCSGSTFTVLPVDGVDGDIVPSGTIYSWPAPSVSGVTGEASGNDQDDIHGTLANTSSSTKTVVYNVTPESGGLNGTSFTVTVTLYPVPDVVATPASQSICTGTATGISLTTNITSPAVTYSWTASLTSGTASGFTGGSGSTISQTLANSTTSPAVVTYCVTPAIGTCTGTPVYIPVTVYPSSQSGTVAADQTICYGTMPDNLILSGNVGSVVKWQKSTDSGFGSPADISETSGTLPGTTIGNLTIGTYFRAIVKNGTCSEVISPSILVSINPIPEAITGPDRSICLNGTTTIGTAGVAGNTYSWTSNPAGFVSAEANPVVTPIITTIYELTETISASGCFKINDITVTVNSLPDPVITGSASACNTSTGNTYSTDLDMTNYTWSVSGGTYSGTGNMILVSWNVSGPGSVAVNYKDENGCSAATPKVYNVTVNPVPVLSSTLTPPAICSGSLFTYTPESAPAGATFGWSRAAVSGISQSSSSGSGNISETLTNTTNVPINVTYSVIATANSCSCPAQNVVVTVNPVPGLTSTLTPSAICSGTNFSYVPQSIVAGSAFTWTRAGMAEIFEAGSSGPGNINEVLTNTTSAPVNVTYNYITTANACSHTPQDVVVTVNPIPVLTSSLTPGPICSGTLFSYTPVCPTAGTTLSWSRASVAGISQPASAGTGNINEMLTNTTSSPVVVIYAYNLTANGCSNPQNVTVTVNPLPVPSISGPASPNLNTTANIYTTEGSMTGYSWSVSPGGTITDGLGTSSVTVTWSGQGAQTVSVNYTSAASCTAESPTIYNVTVNSLPVAGNVSISGSARSGVTLYGSYVYSDADGDLQGASSYQWYTGTSAGGAGSVPIPAATSTSYKITDAEIGKYIGFSSEPVALTGSSPGILSTSFVWVGPVINDAPVVTVLPVTGSLNVNGIITGHYIYSDTEGDIESGTTYQWYSSGTESGTYTAIPGETGIAHIINNNEQGRYFKICITPGAATGTLAGTQVTSTAYGPANSQPQASGVQVSGTATVGSTLTGSYTFSDVDLGDSEGVSVFRWLRGGTSPIPGATGDTYVVTTDDEGYAIAFEVTPVSTPGYPNNGTPVISALTDEVVDPSPLIPDASEVCIEGIRAAGQTLRGKYLYTFYKSEGTSLYQWYRNGVPIDGATGLQYTLKQVEDIDSRAAITFKVTPRSSNDPPKVGINQTSDPLVLITMKKDQYSVSEANDTILVNVTGGVFSGTGVTGNIFSPSSAGSAGSPYTISYLLNIVNTAHNCSQQVSKQVIVNPNVSSFIGFDPLYCHDRGTDTISVTGVPDGATDLDFSLTDNDGIVSESGKSVIIDPGRMRPGVNKDILSFSYNYLGIFYRISKTFVIDSVGTEIRIINLDPAYCESDTRKYISVEGVYPLGGTADWTGSILTDTKPASAFADPSLGTPGDLYPITYRYRSPNGCFSDILSHSVKINPLPDPAFPLNPTYNIDGGLVNLVPVQAGGSFTGNGVSGDKLFPDIAGLGEHEIRYTITDTNNCSASLGLKTRIRQAQGSFIDIPAVICFSDTTYNAKVIEIPSSGIVVTSFTNSKNTLVYTPGATSADYNVPAADEGRDTLVFSYKWDGVDYSISKPILIDKLEQVYIKDFHPGDTICDNRQPYELYPSILGGVFKGPVSGSYLNPLMANRSDTVTYIYTNSETGCSTDTIVPINVFPSPKIDFLPEDVCIKYSTDSVKFNNLTLSEDSIVSWLWTFTDPTGSFPDDDSTGYFLFGSGGLKKVKLIAETYTGCTTVKETTVDIGVKPVADFYWKQDCMLEGDSIILIDTTFASSPIKSRSWRIFGGAEFSSASKEARYPKDSTGYIKIQYIVETNYDNCIDTVIKDIYIRPTIAIPADGYYESFETGKNGWVKDGSTYNTWKFGTPDREYINKAFSGQNAWFTGFNQGSPIPIPESSSIVSPCFDFTATERPSIELRLWKQFVKERDGATLQYKIGDDKEWKNVGTIDDGIEWYNSAVIRGQPGGNQLGWTTMGEADTAWIRAVHTLDELKGKEDVKLRIAYGSDGSSKRDGFAFDDIRIGERSRNVLLEHFTNSGDDDCEDANALINTITESRKGDVINIQYHTNFPGTDPYFNSNPADASARILFYGLTAAPYTFIDGGTRTDYANIFNSMVEIDSTDVYKRSLIPARFKIAITAEIDTVLSQLSVSGNITALEDLNTDNLILFIAVTEKENSDHPVTGGETVFYNVFRKFIPDAGGISLKRSWQKDDVFTLDARSWLMDNVADRSDIEVIAFIQNIITKELYQAESVELENEITGIEDLFSGGEHEFALYPNPSVNKLTIAFSEPVKEDADIRIYNLQGVVIAEYKAGSGNKEFFIDDLGLKGGVYLVRVISGRIDYGFRKLIVTRD